jgi:hypothetical protein
LAGNDTQGINTVAIGGQSGQINQAMTLLLLVMVLEILDKVIGRLVLE